ncbi:Arginase family enzyme [Chitinophaga costaii]|uniref:Arginase family enzyme n=1 Tax=Chitinophaga costaii TaxID=1335309 RepID=A0A1C4AKC8_9BACT|nr:formimidoylglutamase [Chitinophaga costaii]PUZ26640.1 arginase [Chitinophaga costaii]SCB95020.1 Arginase family enzyme [Chitinophaga costaii]
MADLTHLQDFIEPVSKNWLNDDQEYEAVQIGGVIDTYETETLFPDLDKADIILLGVGEERGSFPPRTGPEGPNAIRRELYNLYYWHTDVHLADIGNLLPGKGLGDAYTALTEVLSPLISAGKTIVILGGSHDLTYGQYQAYASRQFIIEATVADALIDLQEASPRRDHGFLMDMLTEQPNYIKHYNHLAFQSYYVHPQMLETLDKLRFDCYRLGRVRENLEEIEPVLRHTDLFSLDMNVLRAGDAPATAISPNGLSGEEACTLARYAGMSSRLSTFGIYGYKVAADKNLMTAKQISQMLWYFIDGRAVKNREADLKDRESFWEFHIAGADIETIFLKSKKTQRWWMQLPGKDFVPCSHHDYLLASNNEMPERWLRHQERL